jgi:hypothetical protein
MRNYRTGFVSWLFVLLCCLCSAAHAAPQVGWWWNPAESGRGFFVESQDGVTFIGAYGYDADGHATWYVAGGLNDDPYNYTGPLYNKSNGETLFGAYAPPGDANIVGTLSVHFSDDTHGTITWPGGTVAIERQIFGGTDAPFQPFSGWWWNPDESGSGYSVELQGNNLFLVGFMYDDGGRPVWYYSAGPMTDPTTYQGDVLQFANGQIMGGPYHPPGPPTKVATLDIEFTATNAATLTFTEASASVASSLRAKAGGRSSTRDVQPQIPKVATFPYPLMYKGAFVLKSVFAGLTFTLSSNQNPVLDDQTFPGAPPEPKEEYASGGDYDMNISLKGTVADCNVKDAVFDGTDIHMPLKALDLSITHFLHYDLTFTFPTVIVDAIMTCADGQPTHVPLVYPGQKLTFSRAIPNMDLTGTRWGVTNGEVSGFLSLQFAGATGWVKFDFVPFDYSSRQ